jgi:serine/tyrosine/threonine adenylyltransferase
VQEWVEWLNRWKIVLEGAGVLDAERQEMQRNVNPCYVPRQHLLQAAIEAAEAGDYSELTALLRVLENPYREQSGQERFAAPPPPEMIRPGVCMLSCSS